MTSGRRLTAAEAHAWGLVSEVVDATGCSPLGRAGSRAGGAADPRDRPQQAPVRPRRERDARESSWSGRPSSRPSRPVTTTSAKE
jgi:enoyl-CoA hydratase/carnithine racemase